MSKYPRVREQNIVVFGESGSGKTVLASSFFGHTQEQSFKNDLWELEAIQGGQSHRLLQNYLNMRDEATAPLQTRFALTTYEFAVKLKGDAAASDQKRPFDQLRLAWHDYPGDWLRNDPASDEEVRRRTEAWMTLLRSDVALLLVDGQMLLDNRGHEERYLKPLFETFRQTFVRLKKGQLIKDGPVAEFPRIWVLALSKADLLPDCDVIKFRDLVIRKSADDIARLRSAIADLLQEPEALSIGEDYMLLSSAKFRRTPADEEQVAIDVTQRVGLDLILPLALLLPIERRVQWEDELSIPQKILDKLADGADVIATAFTDESLPLVAELLRKFTDRKHARAVSLGLPILKTFVQAAGPKLRLMNEKARAENDHLRATLTQFKIDLEDGITDKNLWVRK